MKPKTPIPGRERERAARELAKKFSEKKWYKKTWPWITTTAALIAWILLNGLKAVQNVEQLPTALVKTTESLLSLYYSDKEWTGVWSAQPEGYVDSADVKLSDINVQLEIQTTKGEATGLIATPSLCKLLPFAKQGVLFQGKVSNGKIVGVAFDYFQGKKVKIASLIIEKNESDNSLLIINPVQDDLHAFPQKGTIRLHPEQKPMDTAIENQSFCDAYSPVPNFSVPGNSDKATSNKEK